MKILKTITALVISVVLFAFTAKMYSDKTISEVVAEKQDLSTFTKALDAAGLTETLKGEGPYTVFAPTDEAFNNLPEGKLDDLLKPENKKELAKILKYHIVSGQYYASDLQDGQMLQSMEGTPLKVSGTGSMDDEDMMDEDESEQTYSGVRINNANVVEQDLTASNGMIHIIDAVVMPSDMETIGKVE